MCDRYICITVRSDLEVKIKNISCTFCLFFFVEVTLCVVDLPGECGRRATTGQKSLRGLHWEKSRPDRRLPGARHLRWILWLERLPNTYRYSVCVLSSFVDYLRWQRRGLGRIIHRNNCLTTAICVISPLTVLWHENSTYRAWSLLLWFSCVMCKLLLFDDLL